MATVYMRKRSNTAPYRPITLRRAFRIRSGIVRLGVADSKVPDTSAIAQILTDAQRDGEADLIHDVPVATARRIVDALIASGEHAAVRLVRSEGPLAPSEPEDKESPSEALSGAQKTSLLLMAYSGGDPVKAAAQSQTLHSATGAQEFADALAAICEAFPFVVDILNGNR